MTQRFRPLTYVLVGALLLAGAPRLGAETLARQADFDTAIAKTLGQEDAARQTLKTLLQRDDVRTLAKERGLDLRRAAAAVGTLQGEELQRLSALASQADGTLAGGDPALSISLVSILLIIIIVVLLTR
jgi:hypothetical protein